MNKLEINIVDDILKSSMALHEFGRPVHAIVRKTISEIKEPTLVVINLRNADPLDYEFINIAFSSLIDAYIKDDNIFIAFKVGKWESEELFTGITKILRYKTTTDESDKEILIKSKFNLIIINDQDETTYISNLNDEQVQVLSEIDRNDKTTSSEIQTLFGLNAEDTSQILSELLGFKFIYKLNGPTYHSINKLIKD